LCTNGKTRAFLHGGIDEREAEKSGTASARLDIHENYLEKKSNLKE